MSRGAGAYARAIERCWADAVGRPVVLSPREWALVASWHERSVPVAIVEETIRQAVATRTRRGSRPPRSLGYVATAVEEAWSVVSEGRRREGAPPAPSAESRPDDGPALECWRQKAAREPPGSSLARLLRELLARHAAGEPAHELDRRLAAQLPRVVPRELLRSTEAEVERQIGGFRERMEPAVLRATQERAVLARLRRALGLPKIGRRNPSRAEQPSGSADHDLK